MYVAMFCTISMLVVYWTHIPIMLSISQDCCICTVMLLCVSICLLTLFKGKKSSAFAITSYHQLYSCVSVTIIFIAITSFFENKLFKLFISFECKCSKLQFGIKVGKQRLRISTALDVYHKTFSNSFLKSEGIHRVLSCEHWCLCIPSSAKELPETAERLSNRLGMCR